MKTINIYSILFFIIVSYSCNAQKTSQNSETNHLIDSLVQVNRINNKTILVSFGADVVTAIKTEKGIVIIDAGISTALTLKFREKIENEFQSNDFSYLINTHGHPDHNGGNSVFPETKIVGHINCIREIEEQWKKPEKVIAYLKKVAGKYNSQLDTLTTSSKKWNEIFTQQIRYFSAYNDANNGISIKQPDITFSDSLIIDSFHLFIF